MEPSASEHSDDSIDDLSGDDLVEAPKASKKPSVAMRKKYAKEKKPEVATPRKDIVDWFCLPQPDSSQASTL